MSTAAVYSSQQGPKFNQRVLRGKLIEKQETLNLFINNVFYGVDLTILYTGGHLGPHCRAPQSSGGPWCCRHEGEGPHDLCQCTHTETIAVFVGIDHTNWVFTHHTWRRWRKDAEIAPHLTQQAIFSGNQLLRSYVLSRNGCVGGVCVTVMSRRFSLLFESLCLRLLIWKHGSWLLDLYNL